MASSVKAKVIHVFGVTGSIGQSAQDVILKHAERFDVHTVSANENVEALAQSAIALKARCAVINNKEYLERLQALLSEYDIEIKAGQEALLQAASTKADITLAAIVGMAGLTVLWEALEFSDAVAIANKEPLVAAGPLIMARAKEFGCKLLPVDSEHNAIFQVFDEVGRDQIEKIILTASGGPFRGFTAEQLKNVTAEQAVDHPNWSMGAKISVDSATMMNKALEVVEAHYLFDMPPEQIDVVLHPQSIVHSMVIYNDGSVLSQMGASDMRTPISNVLAWPERLETPGERLDFTQALTLNFERPDHETFPFIKLAYDCLKQSVSKTLAMNAANEIAVQAFLEKKISFLDIFNCVETIVEHEAKKELSCIGDVLSYDYDIRQKA
ncbi:MAG: 1-deoxy-D-xylulose-5-phosphate reductoisomerase, partial [Pseudomonadota bacterium]